MSQMALIEINCKIENIQEINKFSLDGMTFLTTDQKYQLDFMNVAKIYIHILNDYESNELDMLLFDYEIDLDDYDKIFQIISPIFELSMCLINKYKIDTKEIKVFISEDCNVKYEDFIRININPNDVKGSFIKYLSKNKILEINCFPPIMFCFGSSD